MIPWHLLLPLGSDLSVSLLSFWGIGSSVTFLYIAQIRSTPTNVFSAYGLPRTPFPIWFQSSISCLPQLSLALNCFTSENGNVTSSASLLMSNCTICISWHTPVQWIPRHKKIPTSCWRGGIVCIQPSPGFTYPFPTCVGGDVPEEAHVSIFGGIALCYRHSGPLSINT